jgi:hypothetical protein
MKVAIMASLSAKRNMKINAGQIFSLQVNDLALTII